MVDEVHQRLWSNEEIPKDWKRSSLVPVYKGRRDVLYYGNDRGIKLLEDGLKIYERILDKRLRQQVDIDETQFGFMQGKGNLGAFFILTQRQEKILEGNGTMYTAFVDL